jgi:hypothetical protein
MKQVNTQSAQGHDNELLMVFVCVSSFSETLLSHGGTLFENILS